MMGFDLTLAAISFMAFLVGIPILLAIARLIGLYVAVGEREAHVFVLFGNITGVIDEPGLHFLWSRLGPAALIINWIGRDYVIDLSLDQYYLRSEAVNSEEGAPMGVGIWYEMFISDPTAYLFRNADPRGSLRANVSSSIVRCLSNLPLGEMLSDRHAMSSAVRNEVSAKSQEWGYKLGSVYVRKVHFRDTGMIKQIESKVVNRLRQVTSAIKQDGANQVSIITSTAERQAAIEFAKAGAIRPSIVGSMLEKISNDKEVADAMFEILETQNILESKAKITILPEGNPLLTTLLSARSLAKA
jgi:regulator of protease activity HflC (stomatin/prohibitin superfamily)